MEAFNLLVFEERPTNFLVVSEPSSPNKDPGKSPRPTRSSSSNKNFSTCQQTSNVQIPHPHSNSSPAELKTPVGSGDVSRARQNSLLDIIEGVEDDSASESEGNLGVSRKRDIISQILFLYDLMQKVNHFRIISNKSE